PTGCGAPVSLSLGYADALARAGVPVELHVFPAGPHGLALAPDQPVALQWLRCCEDWLRRTVMSDQRCGVGAERPAASAVAVPAPGPRRRRSPPHGRSAPRPAGCASAPAPSGAPG